MAFRPSSGLKSSLLLQCILFIVGVSATSFKAHCNAFGKSIHIPNVTVAFTDFVANGTNITFPNNDPTCSRPYQIVYGGDLCRIRAHVATSDASGITLEAWFPSNWTGRFLATGNGGVGGCIQYEDIAYGNFFGFATVASNNGHDGMTGKPFLHAPGVIEDFAWRALYTETIVGKELTNQFYNKQFTKAYYLGCSTGGRQGMKMAQAYPDLFHGIVAGAPAWDFNNLDSWGGYLGLQTGFDNTSSSFVPIELWAVVHEEILKQCDGLDGAIDGIIEDPDLCHPVFSNLICSSSAANKSMCLNGAQVARVAGVFSDFYGQNGTLLFPRLQPGAELSAFNIYLSGQPFPYTVDWFRYAILSDPTWDPTTFNLADATLADDLNLFNISTFDADLYGFKNAGGKILTYQGMQDQVITSDNSERYYKKLAQTMNLPPSDLDSFYRYFRISGMGHCSHGPGAWSIGQVYSGDPKSFEVEDNILLAMVDWVENGVAPDFVRGTKYVNDTAALGVDFRRKHCKFPARNTYVGPGNSTDENAWKCVLDLGTLT